MIFTIQDDRTGSKIKLYLGESLEKVNRYAKKRFKLTNEDLHFDNEETLFEGVSYLKDGGAIVWIHKSIIDNEVKLYAVLIHELMHVGFHLNNHWEDEEPPQCYDVCLKSEANYIDLVESLFRKAVGKINQRVNRKKKKSKGK